MLCSGGLIQSSSNSIMAFSEFKCQQVFYLSSCQIQLFLVWPGHIPPQPPAKMCDSVTVLEVSGIMPQN